jgi:transposase
MEITEEQYARIKDSLPVQRGNVSLTNLQVLNAILFVAEQGCKWRALPKRFGRWHTIYMRMSRWAKNGVLDRVFGRYQTNFRSARDRHRSSKTRAEIHQRKVPLQSGHAVQIVFGGSAGVDPRPPGVEHDSYWKGVLGQATRSYNARLFQVSSPAAGKP